MYDNVAHSGIHIETQVLEMEILQWQKQQSIDTIDSSKALMKE